MMPSLKRGNRRMHAAQQRQRALSRTSSALSVRRPRWAAFALVLPVALTAVGCGSPESSPTSVRVVKGSVTRAVSGTGTLQAVTEQKLGFAKGGKLTKVMVTVGQEVNAGQPLASIDDLDAKADLQQAQAKLTEEQAALDRIEDSNSEKAAHDDSDQAKNVLAATEEQADAVDQANSDAIDQMEERLDGDRESLRRAEEQAEADQDRCDRSLTGNSAGYGDDADGGARGLLLESPVDVHSPSCERSNRGKAAVANYQRRVDAGERQIEQAKKRRDVDRARQQVAVENARREATAAENNADGASSRRPHDINEQAALVSDASAEVRRAQRAVADTTLLAPVSGKVAAINGAVGEYVAASSATTPLAPGGRAALPDMDSGVGAQNATGNGPERPGGPAFIVLKDVNSFQVVVPFEEADAAQIHPNQKVQLAFDAIPGLTRAGTVTSVAPTGTQIKDVTNYYVTVVLNEVDPRLRGGQTAEANVLVGQVDHVLVVPTAAVQRGGRTGVVQVLEADGRIRQIQVQIGMVGDNATEIVSGLTEGQRVVIPES